MAFQGEQPGENDNTKLFNNAPEQGNQVPPEQSGSRGFFIALISFGAVGLLLGIVSLAKNIQSPFVPNANLIAVQQDTNQENISDLQQRDTDGDGLSDYEELYQYNTSPYLADSDSDTIDDKKEIESGNDPNCPSGQDCTGLGVNTNTSTVDDALGLTNSSTNTSATNTSTSTSAVDMAQLREVLKASGAPAYVVDSTDDATLLELYNELVAEQGGDSLDTNSTDTNASNTSTVDDATTLQLLQSLSASEIRALLIQSGVDQSLIDQVDDSELQQIFLDAVQSEFSSDSSS
ncbi:MAG: hypothetical protein H6760_00670 [Candidatus Nomurabacteria bacterium]|nr:MAG: hypothetical protein H6760_00670 [Candidatus Nomurabacteria bacterium]